MKVVQHCPDLLYAQSLQLSVNQQRLMTCGFSLIESKQQFQRVVRFLAAEIGRAFECPGRIHQCELHDATSGRASTVCANGASGRRSSALRSSHQEWIA